MTYKLYEITNNTNIRVRDNNSFHNLHKEKDKILINFNWYINKKNFEYTGVKSKKLLGKRKPYFTKAWTKKDNQENLSKIIKDIFSSYISFTVLLSILITCFGLLFCITFLL